MIAVFIRIIPEKTNQETSCYKKNKKKKVNLSYGFKK